MCQAAVGIVGCAAFDCSLVHNFVAWRYITRTAKPNACNSNLCHIDCRDGESAHVSCWYWDQRTFLRLSWFRSGGWCCRHHLRTRNGVRSTGVSDVTRLGERWPHEGFAQTCRLVPQIPRQKSSEQNQKLIEFEQCWARIKLVGYGWQLLKTKQQPPKSNWNLCKESVGCKSKTKMQICSLQRPYWHIGANMRKYKMKSWQTSENYESQFEWDGFTHVPLSICSVISIFAGIVWALGSFSLFKAVVQEQKQAKASLQRHERDVQLEAWEILEKRERWKADRRWQALPIFAVCCTSCIVMYVFFIITCLYLFSFHHLSSNSHIVTLCALLRGLQVSRKIRQAESRAQAEERSGSVDSVLIQCE